MIETMTPLFYVVKKFREHHCRTVFNHELTKELQELILMKEKKYKST